jgi:broad specificity phosphatase PhoE
LFWQFMDFQNRMTNLWKAIALHYKGNVHASSHTLVLHVVTDSSSGCGLQSAQ